METKHCPEESGLLCVLKDLQNLLAAAVDSLGGVNPPSREAGYLGWAAAHLNRTIEGYVWLREPGRVCASKLMVRPMVETVLYALAVMKGKGFLFRKAFTEWDEEGKLYGRDKSLKSRHLRELEVLVKEWRKADPSYPFKRKIVKCRDAAEIAGLLPVYESAYRIYCKFTHGAMRAVQGDLDDMTDPLDTQIGIWCALVMLAELQRHTPAHVPDLRPHEKRVQELLPDVFPPPKT